MTKIKLQFMRTVITVLMAILTKVYFDSKIETGVMAMGEATIFIEKLNDFEHIEEEDFR